MKTRIAIIHATRLAVAPIAAAFDAVWPEAERMDLLDETLSKDLADANRISKSLVARFIALAEYARLANAKGILFSCSSFGPAIEAAREVNDLPILKPNEAMFAEALGQGSRIGMLSTFEPSIAPMRDELMGMAKALGKQIEFEAVCAPKALAALDANDGEEHNRILAERARSLIGCDVIMMGQFSMARAADLVRKEVPIPVLTSPACAVVEMRKRVRV